MGTTKPPPRKNSQLAASSYPRAKSKSSSRGQPRGGSAIGPLGAIGEWNSIAIGGISVSIHSYSHEIAAGFADATGVSADLAQLAEALNLSMLEVSQISQFQVEQVQVEHLEPE